jgi:hypothetical protein
MPLALKRLAGEILPAELERLASTDIELQELVPPPVAQLRDALLGRNEIGHVPAHAVQLI